MTERGSLHIGNVCLWGFFALALVHLTEGDSLRCLEQKDEYRPRRFLSYNGTTLNITLQVSERTPHRLATAALQIFLSEVLGYEDVVTVPEPPGHGLPDIISDLSATRPDGSRSVPPAMINLEVMVPTDFDITYYLTESGQDSVVNYGDLVPPIRLGWYAVNTAAAKHDITWQNFANPVQASQFALAENVVGKYAAENNISSLRYFCEESYCINGTYTPTLCQMANVTCATLLTTYTHETGFVVRHIEELQLYVQVIWVGPNLLEAVKKAKDLSNTKDTAVVFLDWMPTHTELSGQQYKSVIMPSCELMQSSRYIGCKYDLVRVIKYGWSQLGRQAQQVSRAFYLANFTQSDYGQLIKYHRTDPNHDVYSAACNWVKNNRNIWSEWVKRVKDNIFIGGIFPFTGSSFNAFGLAIATDMATQAINQNDSILQNYNLRLYRDNGECRADKVMKIFIDYILVSKIYDKLIGIVGPACSETLEPLAGVSKHYKTAIVSYSAEGMSFSDRQKYPYFFRTIGENRQYKHVYYSLLQRLGWRRVSALTEDGQKHTEYISYMENFLVKNGVEFVANIKFPRDDKNASLSLYLEELQNKRARVIIADVDEATARAVMCAAHGHGMTARDGYVWFLPAWLPARWFDAPKHNELFNETVPCSEAQMKEAIEGYFSITHAPFAADSLVMQENVTVSEWRSRYDKECSAMVPTVYRGHSTNRYLPADGDLRSPYAGYAYDAVWTYALAVDRLVKDYPAALSDLHHDKYADLLVRYIGETNFDGVSGNIQFRGGSSRFSVINIMQWMANESTVVGSFYPNISDTKPEIVGGRLELFENNIVWLTKNGEVPDDGTEKCTFQFLADILNTDCHQSFVVFNVLIFVLLALLLIAAFFYCKRRFERRYQKHMLSMGLDILTPTKIATLDKWEIPRERIVINRKLGMGAFGTVYGGHALFDEEKGWTAVAVKTLKVGTNTEEKLDFLSEAEAMKRFEHKNIVKLLAVITKTEPVCTVMEFMLYGDLKNYLLARRHLVNERDSEESDEVSSKKLTSMALDVARALSYLADLKYVHRDVACRNCLVNSHRVIKLGDFGMTRLIFENDYYRFSRKGMLPVRWMAPESLGLGIFSQASDIWSYGVLLYEIITFGSLPFQGLSNSEVLSFVKEGNTITLPPGIKPQLEGLIKSCWNQDYKIRPHASEIADFLANSPRLLMPCLDVPLDSMQLDDSAQWRLWPEPGKVSVGLSYGRPKLLPDEVSAAALSTSAQLAQSTSTNLTYVSTDLSSTVDNRTRDYHAELFEDEKASFLP